MRQFRISDKQYKLCLNGLASQIMALAQSDAREEMKSIKRAGETSEDTLDEMVDEFVEAYQSDAIDHLEKALTKKLRRP